MGLDRCLENVGRHAPVRQRFPELEPQKRARRVARCRRVVMRLHVPHHARQAIEPAFLAVSRSGREYQCQITGRPCLDETLLERDDELVGRTAADKA